MVKSRFGLTKKGLWLLFSVCAFPIHVWTLILFFRDFSWVSERTNAWDALGVGSYGLLIAFIESVFVLCCVVVLSFILPKGWPETQKVPMMGLFVLLVSIWAILGQLYYLLEFRFPESLIRFIAGYTHPLWVLYGVVLAFVFPSVLLPTAGVLFSDRLRRGFLDFYERLTMLTSLYLLLDFCGLIIVILRNL